MSCVWEDILFGEVFASRLTFVLPDCMVGGGLLALNVYEWKHAPNGVQNSLILFLILIWQIEKPNSIAYTGHEGMF